MSWDMLELYGIPEESPTFSALVAWAENLRFRKVEAYTRAPYIQISDEWELYLLRRKKKLISDTMRQIRRIEKEGKLSFEHCNDLSEAFLLLNEFKKQKSKRLKSMGDIDIFQSDNRLVFYKDVLQSLWDRGWIDLASLKLNGSILAVHFGFKYKSKYFYYMPSFDERYAKYSVGRILLYYLIEDCFKRRYKEFDFLSGSETYKLDWAEKERKIYRFRAYPRTPKGFFAYNFNEKIIPRFRRFWARHFHVKK